MGEFNIPIVLFLFKRAEKTGIIIDQIAKIKPTRLYLIGDGSRNKNEEQEIRKCRQVVEQRINWECQVIKNYSDVNRGVYKNIAGGAKWVFEREKMAIFLEDDNFPALSFFRYCEDLLYKYESDTRVLWICGTNYLQQYEPEDGSDYVFTKLMLPCGWASWANKFNRFYDGSMDLYRLETVKTKVRREYKNRLLYHHDFPSWDKIIKDIDLGKNPTSWDYQMAFSLRVNNLYGIAPKYNLIRNIGADLNSIHGGVSMSNVMTSRFCEVPIFELSFPLKHPQSLMIDLNYEKRTENTIILPLKYRIKAMIVSIAKKVLMIDEEDSLSKRIKRFFLKV